MGFGHDAWKSVPSLVALRARVDELIRETAEPGGPSDCVTHEHVGALANARGLGANHHPMQLLDAIAESPAWVELGGSPPPSDVVVASGEDAQRLTGGLTCRACGPVVRVGYARQGTLVGVRLRTGSACEMNIGCTCSTFRPHKSGWGRFD